MKRVLRLILLTLIGFAVYAGWYMATPVRIDKLPVEFEVAAGSRLRTAIRELQHAGVDVGTIQFELLARAYGRARDIRAGNYQVTRALTPKELLDKLTRGDVMQAEVKLIEGWNIRQVRAALDNHPNLRHDTQPLSDDQLLAKVGATETHPEGLFFPDTYLFAKGSSDVAVLRRAYRAMQRHLDHEWELRDQEVPVHTRYEALILASIIEKETGQASERDLIAGALANRLRIGMRLQVDPTVIYGLGESFDGNLKKIHLLADGPYNTYTRAGLPPTPIAMPGLASLRAALRPAKTDALYYVARGDGTSHFSRTLNEHNRAVTKYQLPAGRRRQPED
jgi:UPF0755 protein